MYDSFFGHTGCNMTNNLCLNDLATPVCTRVCLGITMCFLQVREATKGGGVSKVRLDRHGRFTHLFWMTAGQVGHALCARD